LLSLAEYLWPALLLPVAGKKIYSEEDRSKMPLELSSALSHDREAVEDSEIRQQTLEAIYMIVLQVFQYSMVVALVSLWVLTPIIQIFSAALF